MTYTSSISLKKQILKPARLGCEFKMGCSLAFGLLRFLLFPHFWGNIAINSSRVNDLTATDGRFWCLCSHYLPTGPTLKSWCRLFIKPFLFVLFFFFRYSMYHFTNIISSVQFGCQTDLDIFYLLISLLFSIIIIVYNCWSIASSELRDI